MAAARADEAASEEVDSVHFSFYSEDEIRRISVKRITKPDLLDTKNCPVSGGLYDPAMGPVNETDSCKSCGQLSIRCPGHFGHIEFAKPLYNPLLFKILQNLLQTTCFHCHKFRASREQVKQYVSEFELLVKGDIVHAKHLEAASAKKVIFSEEDEDISETTSSEKWDPTEIKQKTWTSLQLKEALSVFSKLMKRKPKKCANCDRKNPTITSPLFGWLMKGMQASDVRSNVIADYNLEGDGNVLESRNSDTSHLDEDPSLAGKSSKASSNRLKLLSDDSVKEMMSSSGKKHLLAEEAETILKDLWKNEARFCMLLCDIQQKTLSESQKRRGYEMFFLKNLLVPPNRFRPSAGDSSRGILEHPQNALLIKVQEANLALQQDNTDPNYILSRWMFLQRSVNVLFDSSKGLAKSEKEANGIRQLLEKKSGILRQKMMGKRVNFACRSVISPDPYLAVNEIGIPPYFALRLTYPEKVTPWNAKKLQEAVRNGAEIHPGATHYKDNNSMYRLQAVPSKRRAIAKRLLTSRGSLSQSGKGPESDFESKVVYRHLQDGDIVLVNRQPTLHKPSMMAHVVRVLHGEKTIRMHYANCSTYNADFDGDEMNVHLPQDEISRAEAINIVDANKQYIGPRSGDAVRGLIQDHIVSAVLLTKLDTFLSREEYNQLVYGSCVPSSTSRTIVHRPDEKVSVINPADELELVPPAIWKPRPLWTGKQVITTILNHLTRGHPPFTVEQKGKITKEYLRGKTPKKSIHRSAQEDPPEQVLYIHDNELIKGMIDKAQFGKYGIVHTVQELYGADTAGILLSTFSRLFTMFLQLHGFTCGVDDLLLHRESDMERKQILEASERCSEEVHRKFTRTEHDDGDPLKLQMEVEKVLRRNGDSATVILDRMMSNALNVITSEVNQKLFPFGLQKPFPKNCLSLMTATGAKGGTVNMTQISSLLGQQELEGKRVPRMASGKTLPCFPPWDTSSRAGGFISDRFLTGLRPQEYYFHCMAGREGLVDTAIKTSRSGYLQRCLIKSLESLKVSYDYTVRDVDGSIVQFSYGEDGVDVLKTSFLAKFRELADNRRVVLDRFSSHNDHQSPSESNHYINDLPDKLINDANDFLDRPKKEKRCRSDINRKELMKLLKVKYLSSLADPGEAVGVIAAQSIGEPSTQMTLNTFHLAGRGEMNVTLGIPRLQEILMAASDNIKTPFMKCPLRKGTTRDDAERIAAKLRRVYVADVVESMEVCTVPFYIGRGHVSKLYKLRMELFPHERYPLQSDLTVDECQATLRTVFVDAMEDAIEKHLDLLHKINDITSAKGKEEGFSTNEVEEEESRNKAADGEDTGVSDVDDENDDDLGTDAERRKQQGTDEMEYDEDIEKEKLDMGDDHDGEPKSELDNEGDEVEPEEDYTVGGEVPEERDEAPDSPKSEMDDVLDAGNKEGPLANGGNKGKKSKDKEKAAKAKEKSNDSKEGKRSGAQQETEKPTKRRKKLQRTVLVETKDLTFEVHYVFHGEPHILLAEIAQKVAKSIHVKACKKIERCSVVEPEKKESPLQLQTAGVNFEVFWDLEDYLNISQVKSNDIHAMLRTYGVEAARTTIIQEVSGVFGAYGIDVNMRHLSLIADFMTFDGGYRPMNRLGMGQFSTSPFGKMTFETATRFIVESAFHGEVDDLQCPSASVCLGQPVKMGTGSFGLLQNIDLGQPMRM